MRFLTILLLTLTISAAFGQNKYSLHFSSDTIKLDIPRGKSFEVDTVHIILDSTQIATGCLAAVKGTASPAAFGTVCQLNAGNIQMDLNKTIWSASGSGSPPYTINYAVAMKSADSVLDSQGTYYMTLKIDTGTCPNANTSTARLQTVLQVRFQSKKTDFFKEDTAISEVAKMRVAKKVAIYIKDPLKITELSFIKKPKGSGTGEDSILTDITAHSDKYGEIHFRMRKPLSYYAGYNNWNPPMNYVGFDSNSTVRINMDSTVYNAIVNSHIKYDTALDKNLATIRKNKPGYSLATQQLYEYLSGSAFSNQDILLKKYEGENIPSVSPLKDSLILKNVHLVYEEESIKDIHVIGEDSLFIKKGILAGYPKEYWTTNGIALNTHKQIQKIWQNDLELEAKEDGRYFIRLKEVMNYLPLPLLYSFNHAPGDTDVNIRITDTMRSIHLYSTPIIKDLSIRLLNDMSSIMSDQPNAVIMTEIYTRLLLHQGVTPGKWLPNFRFFPWIDLWGNLSQFNKANRYLPLDKYPNSSGAIQKHANVIDLLQRPWLSTNISLALFSFDIPSLKFKVSLSGIFGLNIVQTSDTVVTQVTSDTVTMNNNSANIHSTMWGAWLTARYLPSPHFSGHFGIRFIGDKLTTSSVLEDFGKKVAVDEVPSSTPFSPTPAKKWTDRYFLSPYLSFSYYPGRNANRLNSSLYVRMVYYWMLKNTNTFYQFQIGYNLDVGKLFESARSDISAN